MINPEHHYKSHGLFLEKYPNTYVSLDDLHNSKYLVFNTSGGFYIESLIYQKQNSLVIDNITAFPDIGKGYGRKMVEATESFSREIGLENAFIVRNANIPFWTHMGYEMCKDSGLLKLTENLNVRTPDKIMHKFLVSK
jgi:N-acetylglutamate synthase-like GNAT family acetyltransferase